MRATVSGVMALVLLPGLLGCGRASSSSGAAHLYWASVEGIGRINGDGSGARRTLVNSPAIGVAVDRTHIYWSGGRGLIGRAMTDGSHANVRFITGVKPSTGIVVDHGEVYWTFADTDGSIGRASVDGSHVEPGFVAHLAGAAGIAVDRTHVYWTDVGSESIGRANRDGSDPKARFITGASSPIGVAINGGHIYWTNQANGTIGRANIDGSGVNQRFIVTTAYGLWALAVDAAHIYWGGSLTDLNVCETKLYICPGVIGRANLDGTGVQQRFLLTGKGPITGLAPGP